MSDRQIAATVRFGRKVTLWPVDNNPITGYIAGMDRFTYFILEPTDKRVRKYLVHKSGTVVELHDESTLDTEPDLVKQELRKVIVPFRTKVLEDFYPDLPRHNVAAPRGVSTE